MPISKEQLILKQSIVATAILATFGVIFGLWANSQSIAFEGFYSIIDALMTTTAYFVTKLITMGNTKRFQYGYWHFEPLVATLSGAILAVTCLYAVVNSVNELLEGGRYVNYELATIYTVIASISSIFMYFYVHVQNKQIHSEFLRIDANAWLIGGSLASTVTISFVIAMLLNQTHFAHLLFYTDPIILIILAIVLLPIPLHTIGKALKDVFMVRPVQLDRKVRRVMRDISERYEFIKFKTYVAKTGRAHFIEINILTKSDFAKNGVSELDGVREEITRKLADDCQIWLTVSFTAHAKWL